MIRDHGPHAARPHAAGAPLGGRALPGVIVLSLVLGLVPAAALVLGVSRADAATTTLAARGPAVVEHGYPEWFQDADGVRLVPCLEESEECDVDLPSASTASFPDNLPDRFPYWMTEVPAQVVGGVEVAGIAFGVYGDHEREDLTEPGERTTVNELSVDLRGLVAGAEYRIEHPWGETTGIADVDGSLELIESTMSCEDPGADDPACATSDVLAGPVTDFLMPLASTWPGGYLSDGSTPRALATGPAGRAHVRVSGPGITDGAVTIDRFVTRGLLFAPSGSTTPPVASPTITSAERGDAQATLTWDGVPAGDATDGGAPITGYRIRSSPAGVDRTVDADERSYTATSLQNGTTYSFTIAAVNQLGTGARSTPVEVLPASVPLAPQNVVGVGGDRFIDVTWDAPTFDGGEPVSQYVVTVSPGGREITVPATTPGAGGSVRVDGLTNGTRYRFAVRARNVEGLSPASALSAPVAPYTLPGAPSEASASDRGTSIVVRWEPPAWNGGAAVTEYVVEDGARGLRQTVTAGAGDRAEFTGLQPGLDHEFTVRARNAAGLGPTTPTSVVTTGAPSAPSQLDVLAGLRSASLKWLNSPASDLAGVHIRVLEGTTAPTLTTGQAVYTGLDNAHRVAGLEDGVSYAFSVFSFDSSGNYSERLTRTVDGSRVTATRSSSKVTYGTSVRISGTVLNTRTGSTMARREVELWMRTRGASTWHRVGTAVGSADGDVSFTHRPPHNVDYQLRYLGSGRTMGSVSPTVPVDVLRSFPDVDGTIHEVSVEKLAAAGITGGFSDGMFRPNGSVTRGQMASFLVRALDLPASNEATFSDTRGHTHEPAIMALAKAGITGGYSDGSFRPDAAVTRGQMATFLVEAFDLPPSSSGRFSDTAGHIHEASIRALAAAKITGGFDDGSFRPNAPINRAQMAAFLVRALDL